MCVADNVSDERVSVDVDVESEDEVEVVGGSTHPMTSRQAVLASIIDSSHVALCQSLHRSPHPELIQPTAKSSRKKKQLTESELALRREETARKHKNLTEKKLEDEKVRGQSGSVVYAADVGVIGRDDQPAAQETVQVKDEAERVVDRRRSDPGLGDTGRRAVDPGRL